jgi:hypothetical protein
MEAFFHIHISLLACLLRRDDPTRIVLPKQPRGINGDFCVAVYGAQPPVFDEGIDERLCGFYLQNPPELDTSTYNGLSVPPHLGVSGYDINVKHSTSRLKHAFLVEYNHWLEIVDISSDWLDRVRITRCNALTRLFASSASLRELDIAHCHAFQTLELGGFEFGSAMVALFVVDCYQFVVPDSIGQLRALDYLRVRRSRCMTCLPDSLTSLGQLTTLDLEGCCNLARLPASLGNLASLRYLSLIGCACLTELPESLGQLSALEVLFLSECEKLAKLPESIGNLGNLASLSMRHTGRLSRLPLSCIHFSDELIIARSWRDQSTFPPTNVMTQSTSTIKEFIWRHHTPIKILFLVMGARRRRMRRPPAEVWFYLVFKVFFD